MRDRIDITMPSELRVDPIGQLLKRLAIGISLTLLVTAGVVIDSAGYNDTADGTVNLLDALYYATVSITTTGYGDVVPVSDAARIFTTFVTTPARVIFLVLLVGTSVELIASASQNILRERNWRRKVRDHVVICGFGVKGRSALEALIERGDTGSNVVVIDPNPEALEDAAKFGCVGIRGDATSDAVLRAAHVDRARTVIVTPHRDDSAVLTVLSVRVLNPTVEIVAAARELENAPLLRHSGANSVLTTSGATGRILGLAAASPHYVQVVEELLEHGHGLDLGQRRFESSTSAPLSTATVAGDLVVAVFRGVDCVARTPNGEFVLQPGDELVSVTSND